MIRRVEGLLAALALIGTCLHAGCSSSGPTLTGAAAEVGGLKNDDPMARPVGVAWTAARAKRCGFYFNPDKLRTSYLAWERTQGNPPDQLAKIEATYDTAFKKTFADVSTNAAYCTEHKGGEIKADLQRYLAGDYTPNLPQPKRVTSCTGFIGCETTGEEPFSNKGFWDKYDRDHPSNGP